MDGVMVFTLLESGQQVCLLAFGDQDVYSVIRSNEKGEIVVAARSDAGHDMPFSLLVAIGSGHEEIIKAVMDEARRRVGGQSKMKQLLESVDQLDMSKDQWAGEDWFDGLAYCTWNGMDMHKCRLIPVILSKSRK
jgi:hypothetical protein